MVQVEVEASLAVKERMAAMAVGAAARDRSSSRTVLILGRR